LELATEDGRESSPFEDPGLGREEPTVSPTSDFFSSPVLPDFFKELGEVVRVDGVGVVAAVFDDEKFEGGTLVERRRLATVH
jgi:hypothetical protein